MNMNWNAYEAFKTRKLEEYMNRIVDTQGRNMRKKRKEHVVRLVKDALEKAELKIRQTDFSKRTQDPVKLGRGRPKLANWAPEGTEPELPRSFPIRLIKIQTMQLVSQYEAFQHMFDKLREALINNLDELLRLAEKEDLKAQSLPQFAIDVVEKATEEVVRFAILSHQWGSSEITLPMFEKLSRVTSTGLVEFVSGLNPNALGTSFQSANTLISTLLEHSLSASARATYKPIEQPLVGLLDDLLASTIAQPWDGLVGLRKLVRFCYLAKHSFGCEFAWSDTCCIDKTSSAELDESIRSMFKWYRDSTICLTYLRETTDMGSVVRDSWFSRGWTLQELLAPEVIKFFDCHWRPLTALPNDKISKAHPGGADTIMDMISSVYHIQTQDLLKFTPGLQNIRERMVWASKRRTTRIEDKAYCLLGIFDITIPIAYGEGENAFYRLQAAIMEESNDRGLFLWEDNFITGSRKCSMLANGPESFGRGFHGIKVHTDVLPSALRSRNFNYDPTYMLTNFGIRITVSLYNDDVVFKYFHLKKDLDDPEDYLGYMLVILGYTLGDDQSTLHPIFFMLEKHKKGNAIYYERAWIVDHPPEISERPNEPEVIYIK